MALQKTILNRSDVFEYNAELRRRKQIIKCVNLFAQNRNSSLNFQMNGGGW